jgi:hypothetical protein
MWKAALAGAFALAIIGSLSVSSQGIGVTHAAAQDLVLTESHIVRLKHALRLTASQERHWRTLEAVLRDIALRRQSDETTGLVQRVRARVRNYVLDASAVARISAAARPLINSLDDDQRREGMQVVQAMGFASLF